MFEALKNVANLLDDMVKHPDLWPLLEIAILGIFLIASVCIFIWATKDRKSIGSTVEIPTFLLTGPLKDSMDVSNRNAEETRRAMVAIGELKDGVRTLDKGQGDTHQLLEDILRNQEVIRPDPTVKVDIGNPKTHHRKPP